MFALLTQSPLAPFVEAGNLKYFEIWNEPDISWKVAAKDQFWGGCWGDDTDAYFGGGYFAEMLKVLYPRMKSAYPSITTDDVQVILGGLLLDCNPDNPPANKTCESGRFFEGVLRNNGGAYLDGVAFHSVDYYNGAIGAYYNPNWMTSNQTGVVSESKAAFLKTLLKKYNVTGKYLINTENALVCDTCAGDWDFENTKAYYVAETFSTAIFSGLAGNIWYDWTGTWKRNNGILTDTVPPTSLPAYESYKFASNQLYSKTAIRKIVEFPGVIGYEFKNQNEIFSDKRLWILWSKDNINENGLGGHTVFLPSAPASGSLCGTNNASCDVSGLYYPPMDLVNNKFNITAKPVYILMPQSVTRAVHPIIKKEFALKNGDFEQGVSSWSWYTALPANVISTPQKDRLSGGDDPYLPDGTYTALLGNSYYQCNTPIPTPYNIYGAAEQQILVPSAAGQTPRLYFDYIIYSEDASTSGLYDRFEVYLNDITLAFSDGNLNGTSVACGKWWRVPSSANPRNGVTSGWATGSIDLSAYRGQIVNVSFRNYLRYDTFYNTYTYLDNVRLVVEP